MIRLVWYISIIEGDHTHIALLFEVYQLAGEDGDAVLVPGTQLLQQLDLKSKTSSAGVREVQVLSLFPESIELEACT